MNARTRGSPRRSCGERVHADRSVCQAAGRGGGARLEVVATNQSGKRRCRIRRPRARGSRGRRCSRTERRRARARCDPRRRGARPGAVVGVCDVVLASAAGVFGVPRRRKYPGDATATGETRRARARRYPCVSGGGPTRIATSTPSSTRSTRQSSSRRSMRSPGARRERGQERATRSSPKVTGALTSRGPPRRRRGRRRGLRRRRGGSPGSARSSAGRRP